MNTSSKRKPQAGSQKRPASIRTKVSVLADLTDSIIGLLRMQQKDLRKLCLPRRRGGSA